MRVRKEVSKHETISDFTDFNYLQWGMFNNDHNNGPDPTLIHTVVAVHHSLAKS